jgi:hypothetical protein
MRVEQDKVRARAARTAGAGRHPASRVHAARTGSKEGGASA